MVFVKHVNVLQFIIFHLNNPSIYNGVQKYEAILQNASILHSSY